MQVIGLTASVGVGKAKSMQQAVDHVLTLCANLDCQDISTVRDNIDELNRHANKPTEGTIVVDLLLITYQFLLQHIVFKNMSHCHMYFLIIGIMKT